MLGRRPACTRSRSASARNGARRRPTTSCITRSLEAPRGKKLLGAFMKLAVVLVGVASFFASSALLAQSSTKVLFIGNSFTYAAGSAVHYYRAGTVTDLND